MADDFRGTEVFGRQPRANSAKPRARAPRSSRADRGDRGPGALLGVVALLASFATIVLVSVGISTSMRGEFALGTGLAYVATGVSIVAVLGGIAAILLNRGRGWGLVAVVLGLAANPLLLTNVLGWASGLG